MDLEIGIVCGRCESYAALGTATCPSCSHALALEVPAADLGPLPPSVSSKPPPTTRESAELRAASVRALDEALNQRTRDLSGAAAWAMSAASVASVASSESESESESESGPSRESSASELRSTLARDRPTPGQLAAAGKSSKQKSIEELMDQAKNFVCRSCSTPVPVGHKFCGRCGAPVPVEIMTARTQFFGQLQAPGKAKLILIRGEGVEGLSYQLNAENHVVGKAGELVFPDDPFVSPRHANFFYKDGALRVRDEGSLNGVYIRVRGSVDLTPEDHFLAGEQVFRFDVVPPVADTPEADGTYFYASPKHHSPFRVTQVLQGGGYGMTVCARGSSLQIGREGGDLNFPTDLYMSGSHCKIEETGPGAFRMTDMSSRNGTYIRLRSERELGHGDYLFIGRKLLRVEITAA